jgi:hypothetical protein
MKVLFLHFASETRDAKASRLAKSGAQLIVEEPRWPRFSEVARREKPAAIVIDFSKAPSHALETADYLSKAKDTRELELFAMHVFDDRKDLLKERVPKIQVYSERELSAVIAERLPKWEAQRAAAEEAAREERQHRAEERKAAAAASRSVAREKRMALKAATAPEAPAQAPRSEPRKAEKSAAKVKKKSPAKAKKSSPKPSRKKKPARPKSRARKAPARKVSAKKARPGSARVRNASKSQKKK